STGDSLTTTVAMVFAANIWNSTTATPAVNGSGQFSIQVRPTPASVTDVVVDINGYYAAANTTNQDYINIVGDYTGGGLLFVWNQLANGAAIHALGNGSQVYVAFGSNALDIGGGIFRVEGAGVDSGTV